MDKAEVTKEYLENILFVLKEAKNMGITYGYREELNKNIKKTQYYIDKLK